MRLEQHAQGDTVLLSEAQIRLLERHSVEFRCRRVEASRPGGLLNQDSFYWGTLKGVGKVYVLVVVDVFCSLALARVQGRHEDLCRLHLAVHPTVSIVKPE
jgi:transposase InsO family protein